MIIGCLVVVLALSGPDIVHVDLDAPPGGDGLTWATAFDDVQAGLDAASSLGPGAAVWIAEGTYTPHASDREVSFLIPPDIEVLGGFDGTESSIGERQIDAHPTILSGDLAGDDNGTIGSQAENTHVVLRAEHDEGAILLDGLVIRGGNADGTIGFNAGAGLLARDVDVTMRGCTFTDCRATRDAAISISDAQAGSVLPIAFLEDCIVTSCTSENGAAVRLNVFDGLVIGCAFEGNTGPSAILADLAVREGTLLVEHSTFTDNTGTEGAAILIERGFTTIENCLFEGNDAEDRGGAVSAAGEAIESLTIRGSTFLGNSCGIDGGGLHASIGRLTIEDTTFEDNHADRDGSALWGGRFRVDLERVHCVGNTSDNRGTVFVDGDLVTIQACSFIANSTDDDGGAVFSSEAFLDVANSLFIGNETTFGDGAAIRIVNGRGLIRHCTVHANEATFGRSAIAVETDITEINNSILWANRDLGGSGVSAQVEPLTLQDEVIVRDSVIFAWDGSLPGSGSHGDDPMFRDQAGPDGTVGTGDEDLRLVSGSPCVDAGTNGRSGRDPLDLDDDGDVCEWLPTDLDGVSRRQDDPLTTDSGLFLAPFVDMGCYEIGGAVPNGPDPCPADVSADCQVDIFDVLAFLERLETGAPDADWNADTVLDIFDVLAFLADFESPCWEE